MQSPLGSAPTGFSRRQLIKGGGVAALGLMTTAALAACAPTPSSGSTSGSGTKTLNLMLASWVDASFIRDVMQKSAADPLGVKLNLMTVDDGTYPAQAAAAQKSGQVPDLIFWTAQGIPSLQAAGVKLADLTSYAKTENQSDFYAQNYKASTIDGKLYGLGFRCNTRGLVYRKDIAEAAGLTAPESWTFDEFGKFATGLNSSSVNGFAFEAKVGDGRASSNFLPLLWSTGAPLVTGGAGSFTIGFSDEQAQKVLQFYYDAVNTWKSTPKDVANWGYQETDSKFAKGTLASYSAGPFVFANVEQYPDTKKNLAVAPLPNAGTPASFWEEHTLMIHQDAPNRDLAEQFLKNMRSVKTQTVIAGREGDAQLSVRPQVNATAITNDVLKGFAKILDTAVVPEPINIAPLMNNAILPAIESVCLGSASVQAAAGTLRTNFQKALDQINHGS